MACKRSSVRLRYSPPKGRFHFGAALVVHAFCHLHPVQHQHRPLLCRTCRRSPTTVDQGPQWREEQKHKGWNTMGTPLVQVVRHPRSGRGHGAGHQAKKEPCIHPGPDQRWIERPARSAGRSSVRLRYSPPKGRFHFGAALSFGALATSIGASVLHSCLCSLSASPSRRSAVCRVPALSRPPAFSTLITEHIKHTFRTCCGMWQETA